MFDREPRVRRLSYRPILEADQAGKLDADRRARLVASLRARALDAEVAAPLRREWLRMLAGLGVFDRDTSDALVRLARAAPRGGLESSWIPGLPSMMATLGQAVPTPAVVVFVEELLDDEDQRRRAIDLLWSWRSRSRPRLP